MEGEHIRCVENTPEVHNVIVCTLCSCYPWPILGLPPAGTSSPPYRVARRARAARCARASSGSTLPEEVEIRVWDSSADLRYMVLPSAPRAPTG